MATTLSARRHYRRGVKGSHCRGKSSGACHNLRKTCKSTKSGKRKSYCRKIRISRRKRSYKDALLNRRK